MRRSTGLCNYMLDTGSLKAALAGGEVRIYSGAVPSGANESIGAAVLLVTIKNAGAGINFDASAVARVIGKATAETWSGTNVATGTASFFRHILAADTGALSTTDRRIQGTVANVGADMNLTSVALVLGAPQTLPNYSVSAPEGT